MKLKFPPSSRCVCVCCAVMRFDYRTQFQMIYGVYMVDINKRPAKGNYSERAHDA